MNSLKYLIYSFVLSAILFVSCAQNSDENSITVDQLREQMSSDTNLVILDVRNPDELIGPLGHIDGVINIPVQELESRLGELQEYKEREIALICRTGRRSGIGTEILLRNGFSAKNVLGGMIEYRATESKEK